MKRREENGAGAADAGTSKVRSSLALVPEEPLYTLEDIILPQSVKDELLDVANYEQNSQLVFETWGLGNTHKYSKRLGVNLYGPSGTGKTMAAHALASFLRRKILTVNYADIESKYVGETPKNINRAFQIAEETQSILFFDEADAILSRRVTDMSSATDVSVNQTRSVMLMKLNTYQGFIIFATNFLENFDPAFMRRISHHIKFSLPDESCRWRLWQHYIPEEMPNDIDALKLSRQYDGLSGSDIANAVLMAAFKAARRHDSLVRESDAVAAVENIMVSKEANARREAVTTRRAVSKEYVREQLGKAEKD